MSGHSKVISLFPAQNVLAMVRQSESAYRQCEPDGRTLRELLLDLADQLEAEAIYLTGCLDQAGLETFIRNLSHFAGCLRAVAK